MKKMASKRKYYWQPELSTSIIYWSFTLTSFFVSIIAILEMKRFNPVSLIALLLFAGLLFVNFFRYFIFEKDHLLIHTFLKKNQQKVLIKDIEKISVGQFGFRIIISKQEFIFLMRKKSKKKLLSKIKTHTAFSGTYSAK